MVNGLISEGRLGFTFMFGYCLPSDCTANEFELILSNLGLSDFLQSVNCDFVERLGAVPGPTPAVKDLVGYSGVPIKYPNRIQLTAGSIAAITLCLVLFALV